MSLENSAHLCGVVFQPVSENVWKLSATDDHGSILIHRTSLKTYIRVAKLIYSLVMNSRTLDFMEYVRALTERVEGMEHEEIFTFLYGQLKDRKQDTVEYQALCDLICNLNLFAVLTKKKCSFFLLNKKQF